MDQQEIGNRLRRLRGKKTQNEVSEQTGIGVSALGMYENGQRMPRDEIKLKLAKYYGLTVDELFFAQDDTKRVIRQCEKAVKRA